MMLQFLSTQHYSLCVALVLFLTLSEATSLHMREQQSTRARNVSFYAPRAATCPQGPLIRQALGLSSGESNYVKRRNHKASNALRNWLQNVDDSFDVTSIPTIALTTSGGGYRSLLTGAGIIQAFDARDSDSATNGIYQGLSYHAGISGTYFPLN